MEHHETDKVFKFVLEQWSKVEEVIKILKVFYDVTIKLQKVDCTLTDFYGDWLLCELKLQKWIATGIDRTDLCKELLRSMRNRKADMIDNVAMLCARFFDPRFKSKLLGSEIALVKHRLEDMWIKMRKPESASAQENPHEVSDEDLLEIFLAAEAHRLETEPNANNSQQPEQPDFTKTVAEFLIILNKYESNTHRLHHSQSIRAFWEENKKTYPELYEVARIYLAIPPTQSTVERSFSTLSFIYNNRRSSLGQQLLENIILIKLNKEIAIDVFGEELKRIGEIGDDPSETLS